MTAAKEFDKYDILAEVVRALRDDNQEVVVETIGAKHNGRNNYTIGLGRDGKPQIPTRKEKHFMGGASANREFAESIKIGKDISIKRIYRKPVTVKTDKQEYLLDQGAYFIVRTPMGEAQFDSSDDDFKMAWGIALQKYDGTYHYGRHRFLNKKVNDVYVGPGKLKEKSDRAKYDKAIEQLKGLGVEPNVLADYIANKKQNV